MDVKIKYSIVIVAIVIVAIAGYLIYSDVENSNTITIAGSTSVAPVAQALANAYMSNHPGVKITVSGGDSGVGINDVRSGQVDIGASSSNLTSLEAEGLSQYIIGQDAISIIVNQQNPVNGVSLDQLNGIYNGTITNWNQVGGNDSPITPVTREAGSGTRADFGTFVMSHEPYGPNVQTATFNYGLLQQVAVTPGAIGYVAHDYLNNQVKLLTVNNVTLTQESVQNGSYPLTRNLLFLVKGTPTGNVKDFVDFTQSPEGQAIVNNVEYNFTGTNNTYNPTSGIGYSGG
jgi:phosphate transport system substrate-binding protein